MSQNQKPGKPGKHALMGFLGAMAGMAAMAETYSPRTVVDRSLLERLDKAAAQARARQQEEQGRLARQKVMRANGLRPFQIGGEEIWALNERSAQRKYRRQQTETQNQTDD
jgi:hypothetical protein